MRNNILETTQLSWQPNLLLKGETDGAKLWKYLSQREEAKPLFILAEGFDPRMNEGLALFLKEYKRVSADCMLIRFNEGQNSPSRKYLDLVGENMKKFKELWNGKGNIIEKHIDMWKESGNQRRRVSSINASFLFQESTLIEPYSDIIIDVSSMPRSIYFPVIEKLLIYIDSKDDIKNLIVLVSENALLDKQISSTGLDESPDYMYGLKGKTGLSGEEEKPLIWLPVLGERKQRHLEKVNTFLQKMDEFCPVLPFPSKNPRRSDNIITEYHDLLFGKFELEKQNMIYASEQNPFDVYRQLCKTVMAYEKSLNVLGGCKAVFCAFSSKLLSLGVLLAYHELNKKNFCVGVVNVEPSGYKLNKQHINNQTNKSDLFAVWLTGIPYES